VGLAGCAGPVTESYCGSAVTRPADEKYAAVYSENWLSKTGKRATTVAGTTAPRPPASCFARAGCLDTTTAEHARRGVPNPQRRGANHLATTVARLQADRPGLWRENAAGEIRDAGRVTKPATGKSSTVE